MNRISSRTSLGCALVAGATIFFAACSDVSGPMPVEITEGKPPQISAEFTCTVSRTAGVSCSSDAESSIPGVLANDINFGGQGTYVTLAVAGPHVMDGDVLKQGVTVQSHIAQPMGTTDGTNPTAEGIRVFFSTPPSHGVTTVGTSTGTFTETGQEYYPYAQMLEPGETSGAVEWQFDMTADPGATFTFGVYVNAAVPHANSILRWVEVTPAPTANLLSAVWAASAASVFIVGDASTILHYNGTGSPADGNNWTLQSSPISTNYHSLSGTSASDVFAGGETGKIGHFNGTAWDNHCHPGTDDTCVFNAFAFGLFARTPTDVYAGFSNWRALHFQGQFVDGKPVWELKTINTGTNRTTRDIFASAANRAFFVGDNGFIIEHDGDEAFLEHTISWDGAQPGTVALRRNRGIWGAGSGSAFFAVGESGHILTYSGTGTTWTEVPGSRNLSGGNILWDVNGTSASDVWVVGAGGTLLHFDGTSWIQMAHPAPGVELRSVWAVAPHEVYVVGDGGTILRGTR